MLDFLVERFKSCGKIKNYHVRIVDQFLFDVPMEYTHSEQIKAFRVFAGIEGISYQSWITDDNFKNVSSELEPGGCYKVQIFRIGRYWRGYVPTDSFGDGHEHVQPISIHDCLSFLENCDFHGTRGVLLGAQGLTYIWQFINKKNLKDGSPILAIDSIENVLKNKGRVVALSPAGAVTSSIEDGMWDPGVHIVHVTKVQESMRANYGGDSMRKHTDNKIKYIG